MNKEYVESTLQTVYGKFNIRVYNEAQGRETVLLYTAQVDPSVPVLVRLHSQCLTGESFGGQNCDCGEQLATALRQINDSKNGILIYLRQEGRGIGLFEKIKAYRLIEQGFDTYAANIELGHAADEREYDFVKTVLDDFNIKHIELLTNNPKKVEALRALGYVVDAQL